MMEFRMEDCRKRIRQLSTGVEKDLEGMGKPELIQLLQQELTKTRRLQGELERLKEEAAVKAAAVSAQEPEAAVATTEKMAVLMAENTVLKGELQELKAKQEESAAREGVWRKAVEGQEALRRELGEALLARDRLMEDAATAEAKQTEMAARIQALQTQLQTLEGQEKKRMEAAQREAVKASQAMDETRKAEKEILSLKADLEQTRVQLLEEQGKSGQLVRELAAETAAAKKRAEEEENLRKWRRLALEAEREADPDPEKVSRYWLHIAQREEKNASVALRTAVWMAAADHVEEARQWADKYFIRQYQDSVSLVNLSRMLLLDKQLERSIAVAAMATALSPDQADPHFMLGTAYIAQGFFELGEAQLRQALLLNPTHLNALQALTAILVSSKPPRLKEAAELYSRGRAMGMPREPVLENLLQENKQ
jgi:hypothetical protein